MWQNLILQAGFKPIDCKRHHNPCVVTGELKPYVYRMAWFYRSELYYTLHLYSLLKKYFQRRNKPRVSSSDPAPPCRPSLDSRLCTVQHASVSAPVRSSACTAARTCTCRRHPEEGPHAIGRRERGGGRRVLPLWARGIQRNYEDDDDEEEKKRISFRISCGVGYIWGMVIESYWA